MEPDRQLVEFVRANRRRNAIVFLVLGVLLVAAGAVLIGICIALPPSAVIFRHGHHMDDYRWLIVPGCAMALVGLCSMVVAYRFHRGQLTDVDARGDLARFLTGTQPPEDLPEIAPLPEATVVKRD